MICLHEENKTGRGMITAAMPVFVIHISIENLICVFCRRDLKLGSLTASKNSHV